MNGLNLYRGDSLPAKSSTRKNVSFADTFDGTGLVARFANGGSSTLLQRGDLIDYVLCHVGYEKGSPEELFYQKSPLISFTEKVDTAFVFMDRSSKKKFTQCLYHEATHFIHNLLIPGNELTQHPVYPGCYSFVYYADPINCKNHILTQIQVGYQEEMKTGQMKNLIDGVANLWAANAAEEDLNIHQALIIDVVNFISANARFKSSELVENTLERASRDKEWLLFPRDPMGDRSFSCIFMRNKYLSEHSYYKLLD